jgi:hypothetical protein
LFNDEIQFIDTADVIETHDYWHRRVALLSVSGVSKLLLTFGTLIWIPSYFFPYYRNPSLPPCFAILIGCLILSWLLAKGIPGLCLGFCPRTLVRCKKRCARRRIQSLMEEDSEE